MSIHSKTIRELDGELIRLMDEIGRRAVASGGVDLDTATIAMRRAVSCAGKNMSPITQAMRGEGSQMSRARTGAGVALPPDYGTESAGLALQEGEDWSVGCRITWP